MAGFKNIIFDLGGVIINVDINLTYLKFCQFGINENKKEFYDKFIDDSILFKYEMGRISTDDFFEEIQKRFSVNVEKNAILEAWNALLLDIPDERIELLKKLSKKYNLYLLSNTNEEHYNTIISRFINRYGCNIFDEIFIKQYYSHLQSMRKPAKEIFEFVLAHGRLAPEETFFVDDNEQNIASAKTCGIQTHLLLQGTTLADLFKNEL